MKPVCVKCQRFFRCKKNGFYWTEMRPIEAGALPGDHDPDRWTPYKIWSGDRFECEGCGANIVVGVPHTPISEEYQPDFAEIGEKLGAGQLKVNDC